MIDVLTVGSALIDVFLSLTPSDTCRYNDQTNELCMRLGEKLLLNDCQFLLGGNACNVAVGIKRAGLHAGILAEIGADEFAEKITNGLRKEGVITDFITKSGESSLSIGMSIHNDRVLLTEHRVRKHDFSFNQIETNWIYLTSLGNEWKGAYEHTRRFIQEKHVRLAFNPGTPQIKEGLEFLLPYLALTDILFLNKEEAQKLLQTNESDISRLLTAFQEKGCKIVVITDGEHGAYAVDATGKKFNVIKQEVPVVEKTGAGDSFSTGFLAATIHGLPVQKALTWGTVNAVSVIGKIGSQDGLLFKERMEENAALIADAESL